MSYLASPLFVAITVGVISSTLTFFISNIIDNIYYRTKRINLIKQKAFKKIDENFNNGLLNGIDDIEILLESIYREFDTIMPMAYILEDYLTNNLENNENEKLKSKYNFIKQILEKEYEESPFEELPDTERRIFINMHDGLKNKNFEVLNFNLNELKSVIETKDRTNRKLVRTNRWSVPLAIIGLILTLIFGIISILQ